MENEIEKFETIHLSYINGNKKQMVDQMANIDIPDFLEWLSENRSIDRALALIIAYFKIKEEIPWASEFTQDNKTPNIYNTRKK